MYVDKWTIYTISFPLPFQLMQRVLKKASRSHKKRVEDFNRHLDTLTEHYDIPKVSWTK
uniref:Family with sequence similarity 32 member A n=1 Tax=Eptatretus burgeri TaxID=7764 RepID=A0A8C4QK36_EPTBU